MRKLMIKKLIGCFAIASVAMGATGMITLTNNVATAESLRTTVTLENGYLSIGTDEDQHVIELKVGETTHTLRYGLQDGASVRYDSPSGIRFTSYISEADYVALTNAYPGNVELGVIVKQNDVTDVTTFEMGKEGVGVIEAEKMSVYNAATENNEDGVLRFSSVIDTIPTGEYVTEVSARAYVKVTVGENTYTAYSAYEAEDNSRSIDYVASKALQDEKVSLTNGQRGYLEEIVTQGATEVAVTLDAMGDMNAQLASTLGKTVTKTYDPTLANSAEDETSVALDDTWLTEANKAPGNETARTKPLSVYTSDGEVYKVKALVANKIIYNATQLVNWQAYTTKGAEVSAEDASALYGKWAYDGYIVLGNNIDLTGKTISTLMQTRIDNSNDKIIYGFQGTFDGNGYTISNGTYDKGGLFGTLSETGVLKNVAVVDATYLSYNWVDGDIGGCIIADNVFGTVENCLFAGKGQIVSTKADMGHLLASNAIHGGIVKNTVVYSNTPSTTTNALADYIYGGANSENLYVFTNSTALAYSYNFSFKDGTYTVSALDASLPTDIGAVLTSEYWDFSGTQAEFVEKVSQTQTITTVNAEYELYSGLDAENSYAKVENTAGVTVNVGENGTFAWLGTENTFETAEGKITLTSAMLNDKVALGENTLLLYGNGKEVQINLSVYTAIITEADELVNWHNYTTRENETDGYASYKKWSYGGYFALGADIDLTGKTVTTKLDTENGNYGFTGVFDGRGYTITGGLYSEGGLFGAVATTGVVKNVAFVGGALDAWETWVNDKLFASVFCDYMAGTIEECYINVSRTNALTTKHEQNNVFGCTLVGTVKNTVVYVTCGNPNYALARNIETTATFENLYSFVQSGWAGGRLWVGGANSLPGGVYDNAYTTAISETNIAETLTGGYWVIDEANNTVALQQKATD